MCYLDNHFETSSPQSIASMDDPQIFTLYVFPFRLPILIWIGSIFGAVNVKMSPFILGFIKIIFGSALAVKNLPLSSVIINSLRKEKWLRIVLNLNRLCIFSSPVEYLTSFQSNFSAFHWIFTNNSTGFDGKTHEIVESSDCTPIRRNAFSFWIPFP